MRREGNTQKRAASRNSWKLLLTECVLKLSSNQIDDDATRAIEFLQQRKKQQGNKNQHSSQQKHPTKAFKGGGRRRIPNDGIKVKKKKDEKQTTRTERDAFDLIWFDSLFEFDLGFHFISSSSIIAVAVISLFLIFGYCLRCILNSWFGDEKWKLVVGNEKYHNLLLPSFLKLSTPLSRISSSSSSIHFRSHSSFIHSFVDHIFLFFVLFLPHPLLFSFSIVESLFFFLTFSLLLSKKKKREKKEDIWFDLIVCFLCCWLFLVGCFCWFRRAAGGIFFFFLFVSVCVFVSAPSTKQQTQTFQQLERWLKNKLLCSWNPNTQELECVRECAAKHKKKKKKKKKRKIRNQPLQLFFKSWWMMKTKTKQNQQQPTTTTHFACLLSSFFIYLFTYLVCFVNLLFFFFFFYRFTPSFFFFNLFLTPYSHHSRTL